MTLLGRITSAGAAAVDAAYDAARAAWNGTPARDVSAEDTARYARTLSTLGVVAHPPPASEKDPAILGNRLTPGLLAHTIGFRNAGYMQPWVDLGGEFLQKNPHLAAQLLIRRESVVETTFQVRPGKGSNGQAARKAAKACEELLTGWQSRETRTWNDLVGQLNDAIWWQRSVHELMWERDGREVRPTSFAWVHPRRISLAAPYGDPDPWAFRLHDPDDPTSPFGGAYGVKLSDFHPDKFLTHTTAPLGLQATCDGLFAASVWYLLMYEWHWRDLCALVELLGRPPLIAYYAAGGAKSSQPTAGVANFNGGKNASDAEIAAAERAIYSASGSLRATLADTTRVEPLRFDQRATPLQREALEHLERLLSKLLNGSTGVSDVVAGARASHQVAYAQSFTFWRADVRRICSAVRSVFGRYVAANPGRFPVGTPVPELWSPDLLAKSDPAATDRTTAPKPSKDTPA
jgi:hypothetical protein